ncbi:hypothetical protein BDP55DRAFT_718755 [Colletotrichum godetiae]|uniref:Uncharacterized protein n=1 Tax=Colletotrichum godetiae TaxID=1209918 RepID=A0AAJ0AFW1_9PEZI|nr:uncharacterized protein BDP55DRAFT_718755 [Colletotrichum godetiae]KAK1671582.1 hypothetical protein BDP55DRAFT_718755 [Colletotrichum godetiae]
MATSMASIRAATSRPMKNLTSFYNDYLDIVQASGEQTGRELTDYDEEKQLSSDMDSQRQPSKSTFSRLTTKVDLIIVQTYAVLIFISAMALIYFTRHVKASEKGPMDLAMGITLGSATYILCGLLYLASQAYDIKWAGQGTVSEGVANVAAESVSDEHSGNRWYEPCISPKAIDTMFNIQLGVFTVAFWPLALCWSFGLLCCEEFEGVDGEIALGDVCSAEYRAAEKMSCQCKRTSEISEKEPLLGWRLTAAEIVAIENELAAAQVRKMHKGRMVEQKPYAPLER